MYAPVFETCSASAAVRTALGASPVRLYPFGEAPQGVELPYAVWQTIGGLPENYLADIPDADKYLLQVDVYAASATDARGAAKALRDAIEPVAYVVGWRGESRDPETRHFRFGFDVDWIVRR